MYNWSEEITSDPYLRKQINDKRWQKADEAVDEIAKSGILQKYNTPFRLAYLVLKHIPFKDEWHILVLFNVEWVPILLKLGVRPENIWFYGDSREKINWISQLEPRVQTGFIDFGTYDRKGASSMMKPRLKKQFDVTIMNPPYQSQSGNKGRGNILWDKFVILANQSTKDGGYIAAVHPSLWRKPGHDLQDHMFENHIQYLEIHDDKDGNNTFGAQTRYDWYIAQRNASGKTTIKDQDGKQVVVDLKTLPFIPNSQFKLVQSLLAEEGQPTVEVINDRSAYGADKYWVSNEKHGHFRHPCVYMVRKDGELSLKWSSRKLNGHFGIPKVIYASGEGCMQNFYVDKEGEYGLTQWASGIVDVRSNLPKIAQALRSAKFQKLCGALAMSKMEINSACLRCFRKDFWKEFL